MFIKFSNMREMVESGGSKFSDNVAFKIKLKEGYRDVTYKIMQEEVEALGKLLVKEGYINKRIAVIGENSYNWMLVFLTVLSCGGTIVPLDRGLLEYELDEQLSRANAEVVFCSESFYEHLSKKTEVKAVCMTSPEFQEMLNLGAMLDDAEYRSIEIDAHKMSILLFTSGTTSKSKAVMLSQNNLLSNVYGLCRWETFYETDISMALLPFHHAFGMVQTVLFLTNGMCNVFCEGLRVAKCLTEYGVTVFVAVPVVVEEIKNSIIRQLKKRNKLSLINKMIALSSFLGKFRIDVRRKLFAPIIEKLGGGLRFIIVGAAPANPETLDWLNKIGILTVQGYGLSETSPVVSAETDKLMKTGSVGKPMIDVEVKIFNPDERGLGEIAVKGENVMLGYYGDEEATAAVMKDGYFLTGDIGKLDEDGYLFITGRKKNVIVLNTGKNVFPEELETLIDRCPAVKECIVYNDEKDGRDCISAKIVYDTNLDYEVAKEQIDCHMEEVNAKLISYKQIKVYELTDKEMEKTTTKKIKREKAR